MRQQHQSDAIRKVRSDCIKMLFQLSNSPASLKFLLDTRSLLEIILGYKQAKDVQTKVKATSQQDGDRVEI